MGRPGASAGAGRAGVGAGVRVGKAAEGMVGVGENVGGVSVVGGVGVRAGVGVRPEGGGAAAAAAAAGEGKGRGGCWGERGKHCSTGERGR